jgi:hypothetical protein
MNLMTNKKVEPVFILKPTYGGTILKEQNRSLYFIPKPTCVLTHSLVVKVFVMMEYQPTGQCSSPTYRLLLLRLKYYQKIAHPQGSLPTLMLTPLRHQSSGIAMNPAKCATRAISKSINCIHQNWQTLDPCLLTPSTQVWKIGLLTM